MLYKIHLEDREYISSDKNVRKHLIISDGKAVFITDLNGKYIASGYKDDTGEYVVFKRSDFWEGHLPLFDAMYGEVTA